MPAISTPAPFQAREPSHTPLPCCLSWFLLVLVPRSSLTQLPCTKLLLPPLLPLLSAPWYPCRPPSQLPQNKQRAGQQPWLKGVGGLPWWLSGKESACQCRRPEFNPWVGKIPCRRKWQPPPELLPGEPHGQRTWWATVHGVMKSWTRLKC